MRMWLSVSNLRSRLYMLINGSKDFCFQGGGFILYGGGALKQRSGGSMVG